MLGASEVALARRLRPLRLGTTRGLWIPILGSAAIVGLLLAKDLLVRSGGLDAIRRSPRRALAAVFAITIGPFYGVGV